MHDDDEENKTSDYSPRTSEQVITQTKSQNLCWVSIFHLNVR